MKTCFEIGFRVYGVEANWILNFQFHWTMYCFVLFLASHLVFGDLHNMKTKKFQIFVIFALSKNQGCYKKKLDKAITKS